MKQAKEKIGRCFKTMRRASGGCIEDVLCVAYYTAKRDDKPYRVGVTAWGWAIGTFPTMQTQFEVAPDGTIYRVAPEQQNDA